MIIKLLLLASGMALTNHRVMPRIAYFFEQDLWIPLLVFTCIWGATLAAIAYTAFTPRKSVKLFWVIIIGLSTLFGETFHQVHGSRLTVAELDQLLSVTRGAAINQLDNPDPANAGLLAYSNLELLLAILCTGLLVIGLMMGSRAVGRLGYRWMGLLPLVPLGLMVALTWYVGASVGGETRGMPSQFYNAGLLMTYALSPDAPTEKADPEIQRVGSPAARHIVLIIDESISGDFIDLNRPRDVTPFLSSSSTDPINFGLALSASNCSDQSNAIIRLGADPDQLGSRQPSIINNPSIWKYAAAAGFETTYVNTQSAPEQMRNYVNEVELGLIDHTQGPDWDQRREFRDTAAIDTLSETLSRDRRQFIVLVKTGIHSPYLFNYPRGLNVFEPVMAPGEKIGDREKLVNTYKNGIRWSVDQFFATLFSKTPLRDYVMIYTSDHGQNLLDDGSSQTHCRRLGQTLSEAIVPLIVWTDQHSLAERFKTGAKHNYDAASHFQIFPTILELFGYAPEAVQERYYYSLFDRVPEPVGYVSGPIMGRFGNQPTWNSREGMKEFSR